MGYQSLDDMLAELARHRAQERGLLKKYLIINLCAAALYSVIVASIVLYYHSY